MHISDYLVNNLKNKARSAIRAFVVISEDTDYTLFNKLVELNPDKKLFKKHPKYYDNTFDLFKPMQSMDISKPEQYLESSGIMIQLLSRFIMHERTDANAKKSSTHKIRRIVSYINKNWSKRLTVKELADEACLNTDYFSRLFLDNLGVRPLEFIQIKKVEKAKELLISSEESIDEIARLTGFESYTYFSRVFKKTHQIFTSYF